jgi:hypothetical protein
MTRYMSGAALVVGMACLLSRGVQAQMAPGENDSSRPLVFSVGVHVESMDNRDSVDQNAESNMDVYLSPRIDVINNGLRLWVEFHYMPRFRYRSDPNDFQNDTELMHDLGLALQYKVSDRMRLRLTEKFDLTDDPSVENGGVTVRGDESYFQNRLQAGLSYDLIESSNLDVLGTYRMKRYDEQAVADFSDEDEMGVEVTLRHQLTEVMRVIGYLQYVGYGYESVDRLSRDFDTTVLAGGLQYALTETTLASLLLGWQTRSYDDAALGSDGMPYVKAALTAMGGNMRYSAEVLHGVRDSDAYPFVAQDFTDLRGRIECDVGAKLTVLGSLTYRLSTYDEDQAPSGSLPSDFVKARSGDETTVVANAGVRYAMTGNMSVSAGQRYETVDSDVGESFVKNTTYAALGIKF